MVKTPLGTLALFGLAVLSCLFPTRPAPGWREELFLLLPGVAVLALVSSQVGFNHHLRYVFPALPFFCIWTGRVAAYAGPWPRVWTAVVVILAGAATVSSLRVYPFPQSYFNELAGGPLGGPEHLLNSNIDWGQDLLELKRWYDDHPEARPFGLAYLGGQDPRAAGIVYQLPPRDRSTGGTGGRDRPTRSAPARGGTP